MPGGAAESIVKARAIAESSGARAPVARTADRRASISSIGVDIGGGGLRGQSG